MLTCHLYIFVGEVSVRVLGPFCNGAAFLLLSFKGFLCILDNSALSDVCLATVFFQSLVCLLTLLTLSLAEQKFFILMKCILSTI